MIKREFYKERSDGVKLYRTYSDTNMMIRQDQTGNEYSEAVDVEGSTYTYTETDIPAESDIDSQPETDIQQKAEAYDYLTGRSDGDE